MIVRYEGNWSQPNCGGFNVHGTVECVPTCRCNNPPPKHNYMLWYGLAKAVQASPHCPHYCEDSECGSIYAWESLVDELFHNDLFTGFERTSGADLKSQFEYMVSDFEYRHNIQQYSINKEISVSEVDEAKFTPYDLVVSRLISERDERIAARRGLNKDSDLQTLGGQHCIVDAEETQPMDVSLIQDGVTANKGVGGESSSAGGMSRRVAKKRRLRDEEGEGEGDESVSESLSPSHRTLSSYISAGVVNHIDDGKTIWNPSEAGGRKRGSSYNGHKSRCIHSRIKSRCRDCGGNSFCEHGRRKSRCKLCGGSSFCEHGRDKATCKACGGSSICLHGRRKSRCKDCGGGSLCVHSRIKSVCKECSGGAICNHRRIRSQCRECGGGSICEHSHQRSHCFQCGGGAICEHKHKRSQCKQCAGGSVCEHSRIRSQCKQCGGGSFCVHSRRRSYCKDCGGGSICEHQRLRSRCKDCGGASICEHGSMKFSCRKCIVKRGLGLGKVVVGDVAEQRPMQPDVEGVVYAVLRESLIEDGDGGGPCKDGNVVVEVQI